MIPGFVISLLTFPGVIVHEMAHLFFCRLYGVEVLKVCYFRFGNPAGYVIHRSPRKPWHNLIIGIGPFFINSLLGVLIAFPITARGKLPDSWQAFAMLWLAISIAMHSFPSTGDARSIWASAWSKGTPILLKLLSIPIVAFIYLLAIGSVVWLDLAYGVILTVLLPKWLIK